MLLFHFPLILLLLLLLLLLFSVLLPLKLMLQLQSTFVPPPLLPFKNPTSKIA
jgi:hypothetical protein